MYAKSQRISRGSDQIMRVLAISDISCASHASLTTATSILTAMGHDVTILPIAILSTQTGGITDFTYLDLGEEIDKITSHWDSLGLTFDAVYTGYLGNTKNIQKIIAIAKKYKEKGAKIFVDPVLGDGGELYQGFENDMISATLELVDIADYIFPNTTEWALLYGNTDIVPDPTKNIVVTSYQNGNSIENILATKDGKLYRFVTDYLRGTFHCAGDVFASTFIGYILNNIAPQYALKKASIFTAKCITYAYLDDYDTRFGLPYHMFIKEL